MTLFHEQENEKFERAAPLPERMRPRTLEEFVGQRHFLGEGKLLRRLLEADRLGSVLFYGPPGTGKTTLAKLLAGESESCFRQISAVTSGVKDLREVIADATNLLAVEGRKTLLFVDEIHRFNKAQQDVLLPDVEKGIIVLVGATTENPFFTINAALISRSRVFQFEPLSDDDLLNLLHRALIDKERGLGRTEVNVQEGSLEALVQLCDGDARRALSALEIAVRSSFATPVELTDELLAEAVQRKAIRQDDDSHYDVISALIKSVRGSDPDAALYWLARMLEAGEDVRFLARRLVILASEDVGNADPAALPLAVAAAQACELVGLPECQLTLAQALTYLACAPKSNACTTAIFAAKKDLREGKVIPVPVHLRDAHYKAAKEMGHGKDYIYAHDAPDGVAEQDYLGVEKNYYQPVERGFERELKKRLEWLRKRVRGEK